VLWIRDDAGAGKFQFKQENQNPYNRECNQDPFQFVKVDSEVQDAFLFLVYI